MNNSFDISKAYASFLGQFEWSWFATFTFRRNVHPERANKTWMTFIHEINRKVYGSRYWKAKDRGVYWVRSTEIQGRGTIHFHGLLGGIPDWVSPFNSMRRWNWLAGFASIRKYQPEKGGRFYLSKHFDEDSEIDLGGPVFPKGSESL